MKSKQSYKVALKEILQLIHVFPLLKFGTKVLKNMKDNKVDNFSTVAINIPHFFSVFLETLLAKSHIRHQIIKYFAYKLEKIG